MSDDPNRVTLSGREPTTPDGPTPTAERTASGQHRDYWVLSPEERARGLVRPLRRSYRHVGPSGPSYPLRDLTPEERERHSDRGYVKYEEYPPEREPVVGKFWTQAELDRGRGLACGAVTTMNSDALVETYARDPKFYGRTFCVACGDYFPVGEFVWEGTEERVGS
jgi:hypothetical protein